MESGAKPHSYATDTESAFVKGKSAWHEVNHSPNLLPICKNKWRYNSTPPLYLHVVDWANVTWTRAKQMWYNESEREDDPKCALLCCIAVLTFFL
jgi:hypothetical protein